MSTPTENCLIFANGTLEAGIMVTQALSQGAQAMVIAADGGARLAQACQRTPDIIIGDMDSLSADELKRFESAGSQIERFPTDKNETDLELALQLAAEVNAGWIRIIGAIGGRFDQTLANVYLLAMPELAGCDVAMVAGKQTIRLLRAGQHSLHGDIGDTLSLIPISGTVEAIQTSGLHYALRGEPLYFGMARGVSNSFSSTDVQVSFDHGMLVAVHTRGRA